MRQLNKNLHIPTFIFCEVGRLIISKRTRPQPIILFDLHWWWLGVRRKAHEFNLWFIKWNWVYIVYFLAPEWRLENLYWFLIFFLLWLVFYCIKFISNLFIFKSAKFFFFMMNLHILVVFILTWKLIPICSLLKLIRELYISQSLFLWIINLWLIFMLKWRLK